MINIEARGLRTSIHSKDNTDYCRYPTGYWLDTDFMKSIGLPVIYFPAKPIREEYYVYIFYVNQAGMVRNKVKQLQDDLKHGKCLTQEDFWVWNMSLNMGNQKLFSILTVSFIKNSASWYMYYIPMFNHLGPFKYSIMPHKIYIMLNVKTMLQHCINQTI